MDKSSLQSHRDFAFFSFTRNDLFIKLILLFPITTLFQHYISPLNKLLFLSILIVLISVSQIRRRSLVYLLSFTMLWAFAVLVTPLAAIKTNLNMTFYYIFLVFYLVFVLEDIDQFWNLLMQNRRYIFWVVVLYTSILTVSIFLPVSYSQMTAGGWGDEAYFTSISGSPNRVGPASVFILVLIIFLIQTGSSKFLSALALPQLYTFFMGGSRTYFVVGMCAFVVLYYVMIPHKKWFFISLIPLGFAALLVASKSSMMDKFLATFQSELSGPEFWRRLTNSRSVFWVKQLEMFQQTPVIKQILGNGINFTTYNYGLWAHSDFIEILCSYGYVGLANYIALMSYTLWKLLKTTKRHFFIKCVCIFIWFFNAFFNFFYCYFCAMLCYPILLITVKHMDDH